jgi:sulfonate transport system substrate-binding protein
MRKRPDFAVLLRRRREFKVARILASETPSFKKPREGTTTQHKPSIVAPRVGRARSFNLGRVVPILLAAGMLAAFGLSPARGAEPLKIRIAWTTVPGQLAPVLFAQKNLVPHYGKTYVVENFHFAGSGPMVTALATGDLDIAQLAPSALAFAIENAHMADVRVITDGYQDGVDDHYSSLFLVRRDSGITTIEDLKGKVIAVNAFAGALDITVRVMLRMHGLQAGKDYSIVEAAFPNLGAMLEQRKADLISLVLPFTETIEQRGDVRPLFRMKDAFGRTQMLFNVARASFLKHNRAALGDFFEDYLRSLHWFLDPAHRQEAVEIVAQFNHRPTSDFSSYLFTPRDYYRDADGHPDIAALQRNIDVLKKFDFIKAGFDVEKYSDLSFIDEAARRLKSDSGARK